MTELDFWRNKYKTSPPEFRPIIATLGKLIKFGLNASINAISPADLQNFCNFGGITVNNDGRTLQISALDLKTASDKILDALDRQNVTRAEKFFDAPALPPRQSYLNADFIADLADFDYNRARNNWIDFLHIAFDHTKLNALELFADIESCGDRLQLTVKTLKSIAAWSGYDDWFDDFNLPDSYSTAISRELKHIFLIAIVNRVFAPDTFLNAEFAKGFLFALNFKTVKNLPDVDFWQALELFTGGELFCDNENLFYFKLDAYRFFQIYLAEVA